MNKDIWSIPTHDLELARSYGAEDEIANHLDLPLDVVYSTLERLGGFGYVQQVRANKKLKESK